MTTEKPMATANASLLRDWIYAVRYHLGNRRAVLILSLIAVGAGLAFNWNWLVATGIAPILLAALPCAVMCGLGLCATRLFGKSCATETSVSARTDAQNVQSAAHAGPADAANELPSCCNESKDRSALPIVEAVQSDEKRRVPDA